MDVNSIITEKILAQLEAGVAPWRKPWSSKPAANLISQRPYRGINQFLLGAAGYSSQFWLTYAQAAKLGGNVRRGEKSSMVVFWKIGEERTYVRKDGTEKTGKSVLLRYSSVFNLEQCEHEGKPLADKLGIARQPRRVASIAECQALIDGMPNRPAFERSGSAWYKPPVDIVGLPSIDLFESSEAYFATAYHELCHATGHVSRLNREGITEKHLFSSGEYGFEELVAEMGSAFLCGAAGISPRVLENSASYLASWIKVIKSDSRILVKAASQAQKASDYVRGIVAKSCSESEVEVQS